jgi:hypothetical protein
LNQPLVQNRTAPARQICDDRTMSKKNDHKRSANAVLVSVIAEMAKPRIVESAKKAGAGKYSWIAPSGKKGPFRPFELQGVVALGKKPVSPQFIPM